MKESLYSFRLYFPYHWTKYILRKSFNLGIFHLEKPKVLAKVKVKGKDKLEKKFAIVLNLYNFISSLNYFNLFRLLSFKPRKLDIKEIKKNSKEVIRKLEELSKQYRELKKKEYEYKLYKDKEKLKEIKKELEKLKQQISENEIILLYALKEYLENWHTYLDGYNKLGREGLVFYLKGYVPKEKLDLVKREFGKLPIVFEVAEPEEAPILFKNPLCIRDFEELTKLYALPKYKEFDPTPYIAIFFPVFVGLTFADVGYSLMLLLLGIILKKIASKLYDKSLNSWANIIIYSGFFGIVWGFIFNSFFTYKFLPFTVLNLYDSKILLDLPIVIGIIHLFVGSIILLYNGLVNKDREKLLESLAFYLPTVPIIGLLIISMFSKTSLPSLIFYIAIIPLVYRIIKDKIQFYSEFFSVFGKLLSYIRLTALALATSVIQIALFAVVNSIPLSFVAKIGIIIFNFLLSVLSGFIHPLRLHFVEAFSIFYEGGGKAFSKYGPKTRWLKEFKMEL